MDKTKSSKGAIKILKHEKQVLPHPSIVKDKNCFQVVENDFPSLLEVIDKNPKLEKKFSTCEASSFTYSSKLKKMSVECSSQSIKFENVLHCEPKVESVSSKQLIRNESPFSSASGGKHMAKLQQSNTESLTNESSSSSDGYTVVPISNKRTRDSNLHPNYSERKNNKSEYFNDHTNIKMYGKESMNNDRLPKSVSGESNTLEKVRHSPKQGHNPNNSTTSNVHKPPVSKSLSSPRKTNADSSSVLRSDMSCNKERDIPFFNGQHKRYGETSRFANSRVGNSHDFRLPQGNIMHGKANGNTSNKARFLSNPSSQIDNNSIKNGNQSLNAQSSLAGTGIRKRKNKRKSKLKRQAALQTGKILFLTPEVHSKIVSQSNNVCIQKHQNILTNINDSEEYPELGIVEHKTVQKNQSTATNTLTKEENPTNLVPFDTGKAKENLPVFEDSSANANLEVATKSDEPNINVVERPEGEKSTKHSNDPITLSLFDMLAAAKPRKKEIEKKDESTDENNASVKISKKEMIKKNVSQAVNPLASSKPTIKRGKEREKPRVKRLSRMRKLILMERQLRKESMALKRLEIDDKDEDENEEKVEIFLPGISALLTVDEFSTHDNLETCAKKVLNYVINPETDREECDISAGVNEETSEQFEEDCVDTNLQSTSAKIFCEPTRLDNAMLKNENHLVESHMPDIINNTNDFNSIHNSTVNIQNDFVADPAPNVTNIVKNFNEKFANINTSKELKETCHSAFRKLGAKFLELNNSIIDTHCMNENDTNTKSVCQAYNSMNRMQESDCKITDMTENIISSIADININTNVEFNFEKGSDSTEVKQTDTNLNSSEKVISNISPNTFCEQEKLKATKLMLHSRKFRQYCNHFISKEIDQAVFSLIDDLARFQDRMYQKDPIKAKVRRRLVYGIKEIKKHMKLKKVKCIIIATDIEDIKIEGGLNDSLKELISLAEAYHIPCIFSHLRYNLGRVCRKSVPVSCVGVFNYEGSEKNFKKMIELHDDSKHDYLEVTKTLALELTDGQAKELFEAEKESILFLREVSQRILKEKFYFTPEGFRSYGAAELLEKPTSLESEDSIGVTPKSEDSNLQINDEKSLIFIKECPEEFKKLDKEQRLSQNANDINTILVKYKVVKS